MIARIYKPARTAMQSGTAKTQKWLLEYKDHDSDYVDPLMGWSASRSTTKQLKLIFNSQEEAIEYAQKHRIIFELSQPYTKHIGPKSYADNFKARL